MRKLPKCPRCGHDVNQNNDRSILELIKLLLRLKINDDEDIKERVKKTEQLRMSVHLLPITDGEEVLCSGSPKEAQYIEGYLRDDYSIYDTTIEQQTREAFEKLKKLYS